MPDEDNPFLVTPRKAHQDEPSVNSIGTDEIVDFMVSQDDPKKESSAIDPKMTTGPHWESSGTPIWDKKEQKEEVVDHDK